MFLSLQNCRISACCAFSAHNKPAVCPNPKSIPERMRQCFHYTIFPEDFQVKFCRIWKSGFPAQRRACLSDTPAGEPQQGSRFLHPHFHLTKPGKRGILSCTFFLTDILRMW